MLMAQLKGKLTREEEGLEDLLTSNVFGSIKYIPYDDGLISLLHAAESADGTHPLQEIGEITSAEFLFWDRMSEKDCIPCKPDVLIDIICAGGERIIVLVEAKYMSGKSSEEDEEEPDKPTDQLAKEWDNLLAYASRVGRKPFLMYVTADICFPRSEVRASQEEYSKKRGMNINLVWLSWRKLPVIFQHSKHTIIQDMVAILRDRMGLTFFEGFKIDKIIPFTWVFHSDVSVQEMPSNLSFDWAVHAPQIQWRFVKMGEVFSWVYTIHPIGWRFCMKS
ncbi:MAG: hypothetical protein WC974_04445 [Thermoplasmata archaeon]